MDDRMEEQLWETKKQIELLYSTCLQEYFPELWTVLPSNQYRDNRFDGRQEYVEYILSMITEHLELVIANSKENCIIQMASRLTSNNSYENVSK